VGWCYYKLLLGITMADAAELIASLHGRLLRAISGAERFHYQGLQQASADLRRRGRLPNKLCKRLAQLDVCYAYTRHITAIGCTDFFDSVVAGLSDGHGLYRGGDGGNCVVDTGKLIEARPAGGGCVEAAHVGAVMVSKVEGGLAGAKGTASGVGVADSETEDNHMYGGALEVVSSCGCEKTWVACPPAGGTHHAKLHRSQLLTRQRSRSPLAWERAGTRWVCASGGDGGAQQAPACEPGSESSRVACAATPARAATTGEREKADAASRRMHGLVAPPPWAGGAPYEDALIRAAEALLGRRNG